MMHTPMQKWVDTQPNDKTLADYIKRKKEEEYTNKTFEEWIDSPFFEFGGREVTRREWWTATEITAAEYAWKAARE